MSRRLLLLTVALISSAFVHADTHSSAVFPGSSLTWLPGHQQQLLISSSSKFAFGFRSFSNQSTENIYVAVWYANLDNAVVWVANRDSPANNAASLNFTASGDLVLLQDNGTTIWSTGTGGQGVVSAQIEDSGDFVLLNGSGGMIWRSFDNPTDTLLPGQLITTEVQLFSRKTAVSFSSGSYSLNFSNFGEVQLQYTQKTTFPYTSGSLGFPAYWSVGSQSVNNSSSRSQIAGEFALSGVLSFYNSSGETYASYVPADVNATGSIIRRVTLDVDGNLRMYSWDESSSSWIISWRALYQSCETIQGLCGPYGVCINNPDTACICPPGFDIVDSNDPSQGCAPNLPIRDLCSSTKYVALDSTDFYFNNLLVTTGMSMAQCLQSCSDSCACLAVIYSIAGLGQCWQKASVVLNGYSPTWNDVSAFIKVSNTSPIGISVGGDVLVGTNSRSASWEQQPSSSIVPSPSPFISPTASLARRDKTRDKSISMITSVSLAELVCFSIAAWFVLRKKAAGKGKEFRESMLQRDTAGLERIAGGPTVFSFQDLESATNNFSEKLGSGGFGTVYKGQLANDQVIAVKRLEGSTKLESQFRAEIASMTVAHHMNLLRLYGFCAEHEHRLLVYEYMENGSLDSFLFRDSTKAETLTKPTLNWKTRFDICLGTARAIAYLHEDCPKCILHCDIKPQNILLDENLCPRVADFGMAYSFSRHHTLHVSTVRGTRGYLAPEWLSHLPITAKADVFSFGMLLLEIVSGRNNYNFAVSARNVFTSSSWESAKPESCFPVWAFEKVREGNLLQVVDENIMGSMVLEQVESVLRVAFWCIQMDMAARPTMGQVLQMLRGTTAFGDPPPPLQ